MSTSGIELRKSLGFGETVPKAPGQPAPKPKPVARSQFKARPVYSEPGSLAVAQAFVVVLWERTVARFARPVGSDLHIYADYAKGLGICLALVVQFCWIAMQDGAQAFLPVYKLLNPLALPAFMVACGLYLGRTIKLDWVSFLSRKLLPFFVALFGWALVQIVATWIAAPRGTMSVGLAIRSLGLATEYLPLLLMIPMYLLIVRHMRNHFWFLLGLAVLAEMLVIPGRTFGGEMMRGFVYLLIGYAFTAQFRTLANEACADFRMALGAIAVWFALAGLCVFIRIPYTGGATIATLPFASLGLGVAGAASIVMAAALLAQNRIFEALAPIGRNWIAVAVAAPLAFGILRMLLIATRAAPNAAAADLIIGAAGLAAFVALVATTAFQNMGVRAPSRTRQEEPLPIRLR